MSMEKLVLIDGNSLLNRAYYATPVFSTASGMPTNAIFGFIKLLFKIIDDLKPEYLIVAFDQKAPTFRHNMYKEYKATRKPMPEDLAVQVQPLRNLLRAMNIAICAVDGIEADDIIGTLSSKYNVHSYIYTGDRDSFQLVSDKTDVYFTKRGVSDLLKLNLSNFKEITELDNPSQVIDLKSLMGDKSDNISGIAGVGEKTALGIISEYSSLDNVYANIDKFKGALKQKLIDGKESAYLSYQLATINKNCEIDIELENSRTPSRFSGEVKKMFEQFEFKSLLTLNIFDEEKNESKESVVYPENIVCQSYDDFKNYVNGLNEFGVTYDGDIVKVYIDNRQLVLKFSNDLFSEGEMSYDEYIDALKYIFESEQNKIITYACKELMHSLQKIDIAFKCDFEDIALSKYLCDNNMSATSLKELCDFYSYDFEYSAFAVWELNKKYKDILKKDNLSSLYEDIEKPLVKILYEMESEGVRISTSTLQELSDKVKKLIEECKAQIYLACGQEFNINSPTQLGQVLYEKLGIKEVKKRTGKYSTNADILEKLEDDYPVVGNILKYRMYQKLYSTYLEGFKPLLDKNSFIHTTYNQTLTTTGRLSSNNPNLQNIPIREEEGRELRKMFIPREGNVFIDADYSQIELRLLAHFSQCKELIEAYNKGIDIHSVTASQVFGVPIEEVTPTMRRNAKAVNFGIIYGISEFGLSKNLNIPVQTAREYIAKYFASYSAVKEYMNTNVEFAKANGFVCTLTGRKRVIPEIKSTNYNLRQFGERAAMNMPLQGSSADIIKIAMINVKRALTEKGLKTKLILQVHDELVLDAPAEEAEMAEQILKYEMENAVQLTVPLTVEVHSGKDWYEAK